MTRDLDRRPVSIMLVAAGLAAGPATALGLARFAYALLLPQMRASLDWSLATAGLMNSANAAGYLIGALFAARIARRWGTRTVFLGGMIVTALALAASALTGQLAVLLILRLLAGAAGAATFITGGALAAALGSGATGARSALLLGVYVAGGGAGTALSGLVLPLLLAHTDPADGWRWGWLALGIAAMLATAIAALAARQAPHLEAAGPQEPTPLRGLRLLLIGYTGFGAGYIGYMTFIVAYLRDGGAGTGTVIAFWTILGGAAVLGGVIWSPVLGRLHGGHAPALLLGIVAIGAILPLWASARPIAFLSAALFGVAFLAVVTAVTHTARQTLPPTQWTAAIAVLTTGFALGQCVGPVLSGLLADRAGGIGTGLGLSAAILVAAGLVCLCIRPRR